MSAERFDYFSIEDYRLKQLKEPERKKTLELLEDMRMRFQQEKLSELERQKEILLKNFEVELQRVLHQKEEELKKSRAETKKIKEYLTLQVRDAERRAIQVSPIANEVFNRKLATEVVELKGVKRKLEEALNDAIESDKRKANELRKLHEEHLAELGQMKKETETDIRKLLAELKGKDRVIKQLKRELCKLNERNDFWFKHQCRHKTQELKKLHDDSKILSFSCIPLESKKINFNVCGTNKRNSTKRKYVSNSNESSDLDEKFINGETNIRRKERKILKTNQIPEIMYKRLFKEHLELQRSFSLFHQLVTEREDEHLQNKNIINLADENQKLGHIALHLKNKIQKLRYELKESHDQNELLEFCVLEIENQGKSVPKLVDIGINTENFPTCSTIRSSEFDTLITSYSQEEFNENQASELKQGLKNLYCIQDLTSDQHILIKAVALIQNNYYTICNLQSSINNLEKQLDESVKEKEHQICFISELSQNYEQCKKHLDETKNQLNDVSQQLLIVQQREESLYNLEQINLKFKELLQEILQEFYLLANSPVKKDNDINILKNKVNELYKIEKEVISQAQIAGTLQASPNPLLSEIGENIICKFIKFTEKINKSCNTEIKMTDNEYKIQELLTKLQKQNLIIENYAKQQKELFNNCNELTSKVAEHESIKYDLTQKVNSLEKSEQDLVEKNLKLYIDYVSAKEEVQKLLLELENRQEFLSSESSERIKINSIKCSGIERSFSEELDPLGTMTSEDEGLGEERRGDSTGPSSLADLQESEEEILNRTSDFESDDHNLDLEIPQDSLLDLGIHKQEFMEIKSEWKKEIEKLREREKELLKQLHNSQNLISKLHENIKVKEEQVRKLLQENYTKNHDKLMTQEQELKSKITYMQNDLLNLQEKLALSEENKSSLKEQLLELEEAENDARLASQILQEKLILAIKNENELKNELEKFKNPSIESINQYKCEDMAKSELHSQIVYMSVLIQKYEDHIQTLEASNLNLKQRVYCLEQLLKSAEALTNSVNVHSNNKNFKLPSSIENFEIYEKKDICKEKSSLIYENLLKNSDEKCQFFSIFFKTVSTQTDFISTNICAFCNSFIIHANSFPLISKNTTIIQQELLQRLHVLEKEDQTLHEQFHQMDEMNLALWKKLHNLETHVGKCMKEYLIEFSPAKDESISIVKLNEDKLNKNKDISNKIQFFSPLDINPDEHILQRIIFLENSEQKLKERLLQLECINHEFEKELEIREKLYKEKEIQQQKWLEIENTFKETIKNLENEKMCLLNRVLGLEEEKLQLHKNLNNLQLEFEMLKNNHDQSLKELEFNHQQTLNQLEEKQQTFGKLEAKQMQRMTELEKQQKMIDITSKIFEVNFEKYNLVTSELEILKNDHLVLKENAKKNKKEIEIITKDFEFHFNILKKLQNSEEEKLKTEIDHLLNKEKDYNSEIIKMMQKQTALEQELLTKESELEQTKKEYQLQMKILEEQHQIIEAELKWKLKDMEENAAMTVKALKEERKQLEDDLQADLEDLHTKEAAYKLRISELESFVEQLRNEVSQITGINDSEYNNEKSEIQSENRLFLQRLNEFQKNERELKDKLIDMEKKEEAYKETLEHAEKIIATLEKDYNEKIEELESSEQSLKLRINQLEETENCLHCTLHNEKRTSELKKSKDLIEELMESEIREAALREQINKFEFNQKNLLQKLQEMEKNKKYLQEELGDHEEMICTIEKLQQQVEFLKKELLSVKHSENALQETLQQADEILIQREDDLKQSIMRIEEEKKELEETILQLRKQVKELESLLEKSQFEKLSLGEHLYETVVNSDIEDEFIQKDELCQNSQVHNLILHNNQALAKNENELKQKDNTSSDFQENNYQMENANISHFKVETLSDICQKVLYLNSIQQKFHSLKDIETYIDKMKTNSQDNLTFNTREAELNSYQLEISRFSPISWSSIPGTISLEDLTTGLEAQLQLEQCVLRAVAVMEKEMQLKEASKTLPSDNISSDNCIDNSDVISDNFTSRYESSSGEIKHQQQSVNPLPPSDFCILRQIDNHGLLVGWSTPKEGSQIGGYQIYVEGQLHQKVWNPDCTKAVLPKLNISQPLNISIYSISTLGYTSEPAVVFHPGYPEFFKNNNNIPYICRTDYGCVLRIYEDDDDDCHEVSIQKGSCVLVTSAPDSDGFCTVKVENQEGKLPFSALKGIENYCKTIDQQ